ncbi:hypothetical protein [Pseudonocardia broussonetiae]|uniref:hypothetical protein n=1 Tax=Pseudonocardia broussonetiae TaxID=2736640 RepID=UPI0019643247|nr:hypothetical protein [Pseudonocardia broussonetiae]
MSVPVHLPHPSTPARVGQGTAIEQSRAQAEVYFRLLAAKELPRDEAAATEAMRAACSNLRLAEKAFYSVPKGGDRAIGPSVHLARELARIWTNLDYGVVELRRDDDYHQSEMQAFALDLQTNTRPSSLWIQPHKMDTKRGVKHLTEVQAIYESNSNAGARRVRECIFNILPQAFVEEAQDICRATIERGNGEPISERRTKAIAAFEKTFGVVEQQLVDRLRRPVDRWDEHDVADLQVLFQSLKRGEVQKDVEFPAAAVVVTPGELTAPAKAEPEVPADEDEDARLQEQLDMEAELAAQGAADDDARTES